MEGPGQLLVYRAMHHKIREQHQLCVPRNLVHNVMAVVDPEGLEQRGNVSMKKRQRSNRNIYITGKNCISVGIIEVKWCGSLRPPDGKAYFGRWTTFLVSHTSYCIK